MEIIPKSGKVLIKPFEDEGTKHIKIPDQHKKEQRWGEVIVAGRPLEHEDELSPGDVVCFNTGGKVKNEDGTVIVDLDKIMLKYGNTNQ